MEEEPERRPAAASAKCPGALVVRRRVVPGLAARSGLPRWRAASARRAAFGYDFKRKKPLIQGM